MLAVTVTPHKSLSMGYQFVLRRGTSAWLATSKDFNVMVGWEKPKSDKFSVFYNSLLDINNNVL